jgi:hypothetical protein
VREVLEVSERRVCRVLGQHRSTQRKVPCGADDEQALTDDIVALAKQYGRYGYRRVAPAARPTVRESLGGGCFSELRTLATYAPPANGTSGRDDSHPLVQHQAAARSSAFLRRRRLLDIAGDA